MLRKAIFGLFCVIIAVLLAQGSRIGVARSTGEAQTALQWPGNGFELAEIGRKSAAARAALEGETADADIVAAAPNEDEAALLREALAREPLATDAVIGLSLAAGAQGDEARMEEMLDAAFSLSRRDPMVSLWQLERIARQGRSEEAFSLLSRSIEMHPSLEGQLVLSMISLIGDDQLRPQIAALLNRDPPWEERFWRGVMPVAQLIEPATEVRLAQDTNAGALERFDATVLAGMIRADRFEDAFAYYSRIGGAPFAPGSNLLASRTPDNGGALAPIDWESGSRGGVQVVMTQDPARMTISPLVRGGGLIASRLVYVDDPGDYRLVANTENVASFSVDILLRCETGSGRPLRLNIEPGSRQFAAPFSIAPGGCSAFELQVDVPNSNSVSSDALTIERIAIEPA
ncbi:tetratricopeptide repeat protein [Aurantiacibacter sediminis]|uniref:Tetratricopeptide repeat protein n=1 Tax=Aurantiacibacter sediminis TaxID=2793064 RepID=A0ABS0N3A0_9SPHN|nr:hypothetical protein [Aurantiacibacter sediminis]MBH5322445.1 hypothetical protein [Aurantiacibacter sediminis]